MDKLQFLIAEGKQNGGANEPADITEESNENGHEEKDKLQYGLTERPPIPILISSALQHVFMALGGCLAIAVIVADSVCAPTNSVIRTQLFASTMFMSGLCTILQATIGLRLPVFQGPSMSFIPPLLQMQSSDAWKCKGVPAVGDDISDVNKTLFGNSNNTWNDNGEEYYSKLRQLSGSLLAASVLEIVIGFTGLVGILLRFIGPLAVGTTITLIGFSLFRVPIKYSQSSWEIAVGGTLLMVIFALCCGTARIPCTPCTNPKKRKYCKLSVFQLLPVLLSIAITWAVCGILTATNVFPNSPESPRYRARVDAKLSLVEHSPWFLFPYPGQFGVPTFSLSLFVGFCAAFCASMVESVGDYFAAADCCDVGIPPNHAVNRGILSEGLGGLLAGAIGTAHATTSYSANIAALKISKTASRSVVICSGVIVITWAILGKFGAAVATIPDPVLGSVMIVKGAMLVALGLSSLQNVNLNSSRNGTILGTALFIGVFLPEWIRTQPDLINTGNMDADGVLRTVFGTPMFVGGLTAIILDNAVKGSARERGLLHWRNDNTAANSAGSRCVSQNTAYSWSFIPSVYNKCSWLSKLPFMPPLIRTKFDV